MTTKLTREAEQEARPVPAGSPKSYPAFSSARILSAVLILIFALGAILRLQHADDVRKRTPDENAYIEDARRISVDGLGSEVMGRKVGYTALLAAGMKLSGIADSRVGAWVSFAASLASLALLGLIAARFFPGWPAVYAMAGLSLSLVDLVVARRCWQEALVECLALVFVASACEITRDHTKWWPYPILAATGVCTLLVKQHVMLAYGVTLAYVLIILYRRSAWRQIRILAVASLAAAVAGIAALSAALGGIVEIFRLWQGMLFGYSSVSWAASNLPYNFHNQTGPWYRFVEGIWVVMPINLILGTLAIALCLVPHRFLSRLGIALSPLQHALLRLFAAVTVLLTAMIILVPMAQNFRYLAAIYGPSYMLGGVGLWAVFQVVRKQFGRRAFSIFGPAAAVLILILSGLTGYVRFERTFVRYDISDMSIRQILMLPALDRQTTAENRLP